MTGLRFLRWTWPAGEAGKPMSHGSFNTNGTHPMGKNMKRNRAALLASFLAITISGCSATPAVRDTDDIWHWAGNAMTMTRSAEGDIGLRDVNGKTLIPPRQDHMHRIGDVVYARPDGEETYVMYKLRNDDYHVYASEPVATDFVEVKPVPRTNGPRGKLHAYALSWPNFMTDENKAYRNARPSIVTHLNVKGKTIAVYHDSGTSPKPYGNVYMQRQFQNVIKRTFFTHFLDRDGEALAPPLTGLQWDDEHEIYYVDTGDTSPLFNNRKLIIPVKPDGTLPAEYEGFLGYEKFGAPNLTARFWVAHYEIDGQRLLGYATHNLRFTSGPRWTDVAYWRMGIPQDYYDRHFVKDYPAGTGFLAKSANDGQWRLYQVLPHFGWEEGLEERQMLAKLDHMPKVISGPGPTKQAAAAPHEDRIKAEYKAMIAAKIEAGRKRREAEEAAARRKAQLARKYAEYERKRKAAWERKQAEKKRKYMPKFEAALAAGNKPRAKRYAQLLQDETYARYLLELVPNASPREWSRAAWYAEIVGNEQLKKLAERKEREKQAEIDAYRRKIARRNAAIARRNERLRAAQRDDHDPGSWDAFARGIHAASQRQLNNTLNNRGPTSAQRQRHIKSLRDYTYGRQDWHYQAP